MSLNNWGSGKYSLTNSVIEEAGDEQGWGGGQGLTVPMYSSKEGKEQEMFYAEELCN